MIPSASIHRGLTHFCFVILYCPVRKFGKFMIAKQFKLMSEKTIRSISDNFSSLVKVIISLQIETLHTFPMYTIAGVELKI